MLRLTLLTASCNTNSSLSVTAFYDLKWLYSRRNDPDPEMIPSPKMIPKSTPANDPDPEMLPISLCVDHEIIPD